MSLGHSCLQSWFTQAHRSTRGIVILRAEIVQLAVGSAWLRHFGQVIVSSYPVKFFVGYQLDEKGGTSEFPSRRAFSYRRGSSGRGKYPE
jgi:hypothetical protein